MGGTTNHSESLCRQVGEQGQNGGCGERWRGGKTLSRLGRVSVMQPGEPSVLVHLCVLGVTALPFCITDKWCCS